MAKCKNCDSTGVSLSQTGICRDCETMFERAYKTAEESDLLEKLNRAVDLFKNGGDDTPWWEHNDDDEYIVLVADGCEMCRTPAGDPDDAGEHFAKALCEVGDLLRQAAKRITELERDLE